MGALVAGIIGVFILLLLLGWCVERYEEKRANMMLRRYQRANPDRQFRVSYGRVEMLDRIDSMAGEHDGWRPID
jgi:hypothetical protein